jgi:hypothetical protein
MVIGDEITTESTAASIRFVDGSRVILAQKSKAAVTKKDGIITLRLVNGAMEYKRTTGSKLILLNNNTPVTGVNGSVSTKSAPGVPRPILAGRPLPPPPTSTQ